MRDASPKVTVHIRLAVAVDQNPPCAWPASYFVNIFTLLSFLSVSLIFFSFPTDTDPDPNTDPTSHTTRLPDSQTTTLPHYR